jgi:uncharacterized membrane protein
LIITLSVVTLVLAAVASGRGYWPILAIAVVQVVLLVPILLHTWTRVWIEQPRRSWYPPRVMLGSESTRVELGTLLNATERHKLASAMREAILATAGNQIK